MSTYFDSSNLPECQPSMEMGDLLVEYLSQLGVEYVFGVPGGAIEPLYNALARSERRGGPRAIVARHETGAAFMADGYFYNSGKLGVCCATTGPGATNLITGVCSAYQHRIPMLVITAQTAINNFGRGAFQESSCTGINIMGLFDHCTVYNSFVSHVDQLEQKLLSAIRSAFSSTGPAHLSIPIDILRQPAAVQKPSYKIDQQKIPKTSCDKETFRQLETILHKSRNTVFVIGSHCCQSINLILEVALFLQAKIVTTPQAKGLVNPHHPLYRGVIGFAGHQEAHQILAKSEADVIVAIGSSLGEWATDGWNTDLLLNDRLIHISDTETDFNRSPQAQLYVLSNLHNLFTQLNESLTNSLNQIEIKKISKTKLNQNTTTAKLPFTLKDAIKVHNVTASIKPQELMLKLNNFFPGNTSYLADTGNSMAWATHYLNPDFNSQTHSKSYLRSSMDFASMGWAIGAAVGTALANPTKPVVCITGDGSVLMSGQEITVAIQEQLPIIFVILNDSSLGMVKHGQQLANAEPVGFELPKIDFAAVAHAMGVPGYVIRSSLDFKLLDVNVICQRSGPTVLDVRIDTNEVPPMASRIQQLGSIKS